MTYKNVSKMLFAVVDGQSKKMLNVEILLEFSIENDFHLGSAHWVIY